MHLANEDDLTPDRRPYQPFGAALQLFGCHANEVLLSGPAGTGKSRALLEKAHYLCEAVPNVRGLMCRKTRESLTESAMVTFEEKVVPLDHPILAAGGQRRMRQAYHYPNGSTLVVGGLDKPSRTLSTEYDFVYVQEAIELTENEWELLTRPLRNGILPYQQLMADTNPDTPTHWLKRRADMGKTLLLESRHEDNPTLWDGKEWTPGGIDYIKKLDALTGPRRDRLRFGRWVQAEGVVYEMWDAKKHLVDHFDIPADWQRFWAIDFGYTNPFVCQWWAKDPDGRLYLYRELYQTQGLVEDHARLIANLSIEEPKPRAIVCDHDAEGRATLENKLGMRTIAAKKEVTPGLQAVQSRLRGLGDGKPTLFIMRDSLTHRDNRLYDARKPTCTAEEVDGYVWDLSSNRRKGEEPLKENDHGMDCLRYMVAHLDLGPKREFKLW